MQFHHNMTTKCIFTHQVISLDFEWIHQSHWTGFSGYTMNSFIHWMGLMNCCHISDICTMNSLIHWMGLRAHPPVLSMWLRSVKFIAKKPKCACLDQEIGFSLPNLCSLPWLVKGSTHLCTSKKSIINWTWLQLSISDWSMIKIGPGGLLLIVPTYMQFQL